MKGTIFFYVLFLQCYLKYGTLTSPYKIKDLTDSLAFRSLCEEVFQKYSEWERIEKFSRPKVLRLLEILRIFDPPVSKKQPENAGIESSDSKSIEMSKDALTQTSKSPDEAVPSPELSESIHIPPPLPAPQSTQFGRRRRPDFPIRHQRIREDAYQLCGIIFTERRTTAKLLYHLLKVNELIRNFVIPFFHDACSRTLADVTQNWPT